MDYACPTDISRLGRQKQQRQREYHKAQDHDRGGIANDIPRLQAALDRLWDASPDVLPGYIIRGHGVYVWGASMDHAMTRLEALEFMLRCHLEEERRQSP